MSIKKLIIFISLTLVFLSNNVFSSPPTRQFANTSGQTIDPDKVTSNEDVIYLYLQAGVEVYKDGSITADDLASNIALTSSGNMTFSGTVNVSGTLQLSGTSITATAANINNIAGLTSSATELNILDGANLSTAELNYVDGVTSAIQTQLDGKSATTGNASIVTVGTITTGGWAATAIPVAYGGTGATTAANARSNLSAAASGANSDITSITGLTTALATSYGGTGSTSTTYCSLTANVTGTLPIANGGTNATTAAAARTNLAVPSMKTGTYTGDGAATQAITGVGFQPKVLMIYAHANNAANSFVKTDQDGTRTFYDQSSAWYWDNDEIISLDADGFTVGDGTGGGSAEHPNINARVYTYIAWTY